MGIYYKILSIFIGYPISYIYKKVCKIRKEGTAPKYNKYRPPIVENHIICKRKLSDIIKEKRLNTKKIVKKKLNDKNIIKIKDNLEEDFLYF